MKLTGVGFEQGDPLLVIDFMPGVVYLMEGYSPLKPFYLPRMEERADESNCYYLERLEAKGKMPIIMFRFHPNEQTWNCLNRSVLDFENSYELAFTLHSPFRGDYQFFMDKDEYDKRYVYVPKKRLFPVSPAEN